MDGCVTHSTDDLQHETSEGHNFVSSFIHQLLYLFVFSLGHPPSCTIAGIIPSTGALLQFPGSALRSLETLFKRQLTALLDTACDNTQTQTQGHQNSPRFEYQFSFYYLNSLDLRCHFKKERKRLPL